MAATDSIRARRARWCAIGAGVCAAFFFAWVLFGFGGDRSTQVFDDLAQVVAAGFGALCCFVAAARERGRARRAWILIGLAAASWAIGEVVWSWYEIALRRDVPFPSLADVGYLGFVPLALAGMLSFPTAHSRVSSRMRALTDGMIVCASLLFISWATVLGPLYRAGGNNLLEQVIGLAYPASDVVIISLVVFLVVRSANAGRVPLALLGSGLVAIAVADSGFAYLTLIGSYASGNLIDTGWFAGFLLIGLAAVRPARSDAAVARSHTRLGVFLPYVIAAAVIFLGGIKKASAGILESFLFWDMMVVVLLVLGRQLLTLLDRISLEKELARQAFSDPLTGLANRALFRDRVGLALARMQRTNQPFALAFLDLDDFKTTNDTMGHEAGDLLLVAVAERLRGSVRPADTVARLGGDEFAMLMEGLEDVTGAVRIAERALWSFHAPYALKNKDVMVGASVGVTLCSTADQSVDDLLSRADMAMYMAKAAGKGRVEVFQEEMATSLLERAELQADLRRAVDRGEFAVHYQPIMNVFDGGVAGVEALVRWEHPERGLLAPGDFIALAEESGVIVPIGRFVLDQALSDFAAWRRQTTSPEGPWLSVNLSGHQLQQPQLLDDIVHALERSGVAAGDVVLEITETMLLRERERTVGRLRELASLGLRIAIDDFGTGYSSLSYLQFLPAHFLKIDRAFVAGLEGGAEDAALAHAIVRMADALGLQAIAEGVETEGQRAALRKIGCGLAQGHLFSRAKPANEIGPMIVSRSAAASS